MSARMLLHQLQISLESSGVWTPSSDLYRTYSMSVTISNNFLSKAGFFQAFDCIMRLCNWIVITQGFLFLGKDLSFLSCLHSCLIRLQTCGIKGTV